MGSGDQTPPHSACSESVPQVCAIPTGDISVAPTPLFVFPTCRVSIFRRNYLISQGTTSLEISPIDDLMNDNRFRSKNVQVRSSGTVKSLTLNILSPVIPIGTSLCRDRYSLRPGSANFDRPTPNRKNVTFGGVLKVCSHFSRILHPWDPPNLVRLRHSLVLQNVLVTSIFRVEIKNLRPLISPKWLAESR
jgi:hypothetical protein